MKNLAKHGVKTPDGRMKVDLLGPFASSRRMLKYLQENAKNNQNADIKPSSYDTSNISDFCDDCGEPAKIHIGDGSGGVIANLCLNCHNELMAGLNDIELPDHIPHRLFFTDSDSVIHVFKIEFMIHSTLKTLTAEEVGKTGRKIVVSGEHEADYNEMMETLTARIEKALTTKYMRPDGYFENSKAVGHIEFNRERNTHEIIIDGKPYTWAELERNISFHEGFQIKIEFGEMDEDLD